MHTIEYRVKEVKRYIVTRYESESYIVDGKERHQGSISEIGEFSWETAAYNIAQALGMKDNAHIKNATVIFPKAKIETSSDKDSNQ